MLSGKPFSQAVTLQQSTLSLRVAHTDAGCAIGKLWQPDLQSLTYFGAGMSEFTFFLPTFTRHTRLPTPLIIGVSAAQLKCSAPRSKQHANIPYSVYLPEIK